MPWTVAIDPAARGFAWALLRDGGALAGAGLGARPEDIPIPAGKVEWVMERPQNYARFGVAHKDLDRLRATLAALAAFAKGRGDAIHYVTPFAWKGNVPKRIHHNRLASKLRAGDVFLASPADPGYDHNVSDAVTLGFTHVGRIGRGGTRGNAHGALVDSDRP